MRKVENIKGVRGVFAIFWGRGQVGVAGAIRVCVRALPDDVMGGTVGCAADALVAFIIFDSTRVGAECRAYLRSSWERVYRKVTQHADNHRSLFHLGIITTALFRLVLG